MIGKVIVAIILSLIIFIIMSYINFIRQNKVLKKINMNILQSAMMYFASGINSEEMDSFVSFAMSRIAEIKLDTWIVSLKAKYLDNNRFTVSYKFRRSEREFQKISYEIRREANV